MYTTEAELGLIASPMAPVANGSASWGLYVRSAVANSGTVEYTFSVPDAGTYAVWVRVLVPSTSSDSFFVSVDGATETVFDTVDSGWNSSFRWVRLRARSGSVPVVQNLTLTPGLHRLRFRGRETNAGLDRLTITNDLAFQP